MTLEQADKIADVILSAPTVYDAPPTKFPRASGITSDRFLYSETNITDCAWFCGLPNLEGVQDGVYSCTGGFNEGYEIPISEWKDTHLTTYGKGGRYATLDDIRMMAYVGIENYRAKAMGHRWRFNEKGVNTVNDSYGGYGRGSIVRQEDGKRWIKCRDNNIIPIPGVTIGRWVGRKGGTSSTDPLLWSPLIRRQAFKNPTAEHVPLYDSVNIPFDKTTRLIKAASLVGHNDLVQFRNVWDPVDMPEGTSSAAIFWNADRLLNYEGTMIVRISEVDGLEEENDKSVVEAKSSVWMTSSTIPIYTVTYRNGSGTNNRIYSQTPIQFDNNSVLSRDTIHANACRSSFVPLKEGTTYYIYIDRIDSRAYFNPNFYDKDMMGGNLVVVRVPTSTLAPKF